MNIVCCIYNYCNYKKIIKKMYIEANRLHENFHNSMYCKKKVKQAKLPRDITP